MYIFEPFYDIDKVAPCAILCLKLTYKPRGRKHSYSQKPYNLDKEAYILYMKHLESSCNNELNK